MNLTYLVALFTTTTLLASPLVHANHDGKHTPDCQHMKPNFSLNYLDGNEDGKVSKQEYLAGDSANNAKTFDHLDANHDGMLDKAELVEIEKVYELLHQKSKATKSTTL